MVLILLERAPTSLRGHLTRWLLEVQSGVFLGTVSALVRDELWELCRTRVRQGGAMLVHSAQNEQGFAIRTTGKLSREIVDMDGIRLVRVRGGNSVESGVSGSPPATSEPTSGDI